VSLRVVSLLPSATEIVCALGCREALVGVSHECDFPAGVEALPHCCDVKQPLGLSSAEIDRSVKSILEEALSVYRVDAERLKALKPDLVVTQAQCEVCAVSEDDLVAALAGWLGARPQILSLSPLALADVWADIHKMGEALERSAEAAALVGRLRARVAAIAAQSECLPRPRVALIDWLDPLILGAEWMPELVALAGGQSVLATSGSHASHVSWQALRVTDPEVILVAPCGLTMAEATRDMPALLSLPGFGALSAARKGEVYVADGKHYFNRPGPRLVESLEIAAEIIHPERNHFGHEGRAWRRYQL
jgi:iron complex transport system substrate-binding protein